MKKLSVKVFKDFIQHLYYTAYSLTINKLYLKIIVIKFIISCFAYQLQCVFCYIVTLIYINSAV